jgi:hypothetical protein
MSLRYHTQGHAKPYLFECRPQDASLRRHIHGPIIPLDEPRGLFSWLRGK